MQFANLLTEKKWYLISLLIIVIIGIMGIGLMFFSQLFYDQFIWKYFWGPILSDGLDMPMTYNGIPAAPKFTLISEIVYGLVIAIALYGLYQLLKKWRITIDLSFFLGLIPFILYGSIARVLEDAHLFSPPLVFWFVTPLIYIQTLSFTLLAFIIGFYLQKQKKIPITLPQFIAIIGTIMTLPLMYYVIIWMSGSQWSQTDGLYPDVFILIVVISLAITVLVYMGAKLLRHYWKNASVFHAPLNLAMLFGHQLDGIASYISIYDPLRMGLPSYIEKHPASDWILQIWPPLFPIIKFLLIIIVIYLFDVYYKEELADQRRLVNLVKIGIFILGFAPGFRDLLRVTMGV